MLSVVTTDHLVLVGDIGVASMEQMEKLLPQTAKDHFHKSCKSDEIFWRVEGGVVGWLSRSAY